MKSGVQNAQEFNSSFIQFSKGNISCREDVERIIELSFQFNHIKTLEDLAFNGKYVTGLVRIIRGKDNSFNEEYFSKIKEEYAGHIEEVKKKFLLILEPGSDFVKGIFGKKYLELTQECLENLNKLCEDLSKLKSYFIDLKEKGKGF